jgi:UDP-N-acetylmuramoyl-tripeptide--D-alanyl-D-alanine ligase
MKGLKKVKVIGITGSYGKTSTKEFLYEILSQKYKVIKTEGNNNTNIGVAYTVLNKVSDDYDYFICEMGAYKIGEIAEICKIVKPEVGILTGINEQHIDLFGSIENTVKAKFELIEALPENGLAVINEKLKNPMPTGRQENGKLQFKIKNVKYFSLNNVNDIKVCQDYVGFNYKNYKFKTNLLGKHYIENILSAIMVAECLGISLDEIAKAVEKIKPTEFMMRKLYGPNNSIFIDDSYSANPDGVIAALDYLNEAYKDYKKIIVFPGIIELGKESEEVHKKIFGKIDEVCDVAYIIRIKNQESRIKNNCRFIFEDDFNKITNLLKNNLDKKTVVLFESRGAGVVMGKTL